MTNKIFYDERLSFATKLVKAAGGKVEVYIRPDEKKGEVLKKSLSFCSGSFYRDSQAGSN